MRGGPFLKAGNSLLTDSTASSINRRSMCWLRKVKQSGIKHTTGSGLVLNVWRCAVMMVQREADDVRETGQILSLGMRGSLGL